MKGVLAVAGIAMTMLPGCGGDDELSQEEREAAYRSGLQRQVEDYGVGEPFADCVADEVSSDSAQSEELVGLSEAEIEEASERFSGDVTAACYERGLPIIDPEASEDQINRLIPAFGDELKQGLINAGLTRSQAACVYQGLESIPHEEVIDLMNLKPAGDAISLRIHGCKAAA